MKEFVKFIWEIKKITFDIYCLFIVFCEKKKSSVCMARAWAGN